MVTSATRMAPLYHLVRPHEHRLWDRQAQSGGGLQVEHQVERRWALDGKDTRKLTLENAVLHHRRRAPDPDASVTIRVTRDLLVRLFGGQVGARELAFSEELDVDGSRLDLLAFLRLLDRPDPNFPIVTP